MAKGNIYVFRKNKYIYVFIGIALLSIFGLLIYVHQNQSIFKEGANTKCKPITKKCPTHWSLSTSKFTCVPTKNWDTNARPNTEKYEKCVKTDNHEIETGCDEGYCRLHIPDDMDIPEGWVRNDRNTGIVPSYEK